MVSNINMSNKKAGFLIIITIVVLLGLNQYRFSKLRNIERAEIQHRELIEIIEQPLPEINDPRKGNYNKFVSPDNILELEYPAHWTVAPLTQSEEANMELLFLAYHFSIINPEDPSPFLMIIKTDPENVKETTERIKREISADLYVIKEESCGENCVFIETKSPTEAGEFLFQEKIITHEKSYIILIFGLTSNLIENQSSIDRIFNSIQIKN